jgi:hypothetical protein
MKKQIPSIIKFTCVRRLFCAVAVVSFAAGTANAANILLNPGFESNNVGDNPTHWVKVSGDVVKGIDLGITPHGGNRQYQFQQSPDASLSQGVALSGGDYFLSMWIAARPNSFGIVAEDVTFQLLDSSLAVVSPSSSVSPVFNYDTATYVNWTRSYTGLTAGNYTVRVATGVGRGNPNQGMVDDFSLTVVPEPTSVVMLIGGLGMSLLRRKRRY